jgi:hypothetical protein
MTLLSVVKDACDRLGITRPSVAYTSSDQQILQLLGLAQQEGKELAKRHAWQKLTKEKTFTATATETQSTAIPDDFDRYIDETMFNRTRKRHVYGPLTPQEWQFQKSVLTSTIVENWRQRGDSVMITPTATAGDTYAYEYVSINWCQNETGDTLRSAWAADTDTGLLSEELMTDGIVWRFARAKGFDYAEAFRTYEVQVAQAIVRDGGKRTLNTSRAKTSARGVFIQDGNWQL